MTRRVVVAAAVSVGAALTAAAAVSAAPLGEPLAAARQQTDTEAGVPLATPTSAPAPPPSVGRNTIFPLAVTTAGAPNGNYTVPVDACIRALSAATTNTAVGDWALTTLGDGAPTGGGRTRYATRYTAALPESAAGEADVALEYARYVGGGGLDREMDGEAACDGTDFTVRLQTAEGAGVAPTAGGAEVIPPGTDATEATAVGSIVVAGPGGPLAPPVAATDAPEPPPVAPVPVPVPVVTATPAPPTPAPTQPPPPPPIVAPVPVPVPGDDDDEDEEPTVEPTEEPVVAGAAEVEAAAGDEDDGGSNLVPILIGCALAAAALGLAAFAIFVHIRTGEAAAAPGAATVRAPPPPPPAAAVPPPPPVVVPVEPAATVIAGAGDTAGLAVAPLAAGAAAVAAAPLLVAAGANTHDYQIGEGPVAASSPPPPPGFVIPAESAAGGAAGMGVEGATLPVVAPIGDGGDAVSSSVLPGVAGVGATGAAAAGAAYGLVGRKDTGTSSSSMGGAPVAPVMDEKERSYYTNVRLGSDAALPPPPPPAVPVPLVTAPTLDDAYGVPPEAPDFPAADEYGAGLEEPASFGGKMMNSLTGGLGAGREAGAYESGVGGSTAAGGVTEESRDMGMPVLDSPEYSDLRGDASDGYGRR